jgi:hypothetical protein
MIFREVMGTAQAENYAPIVDAWPFPASGIVADLGGAGNGRVNSRSASDFLVVR